MKCADNFNTPPPRVNFAYLIVIGPWWYRELHGRHESRQLQPPDVELSVWQTTFAIQTT